MRPCAAARRGSARPAGWPPAGTALNDPRPWLSPGISFPVPGPRPPGRPLLNLCPMDNGSKATLSSGCGSAHAALLALCTELWAPHSPASRCSSRGGTSHRSAPGTRTLAASQGTAGELQAPPGDSPAAPFCSKALHS